MSNTSGARNPTESLEVDWSHAPQARCRQYSTTIALSLNLQGKGKEDDRETRGAAIKKQTSKELEIIGDSVVETSSEPECLAGGIMATLSRPTRSDGVD